MDPITQYAFTLNNDWITTVSNLLDNAYVYATVLLAAMLLGEQRKGKIAKILVTAILAIAIGYGVKLVLAVARPCTTMDLYCPDGYSFPSIHAIAAFTLMMAFLNKKSFPYYMLLALFVAFTRMAIAAHTFRDLAAALPLAIIVYYVVDMFWPRPVETEVKKPARGVAHG
ncbi:MAG: phosphatase PAP2 family protein [Candidatus Micrarchaeota archaeon]